PQHPRRAADRRRAEERALLSGREDRAHHPGGRRRPAKVQPGIRHQVPGRRQRQGGSGGRALGRSERHAGGSEAMNDLATRLRDWFDKLAPRERRMMGWLFVVVSVFVLFMAPIGISVMVGGRREANKALRDAISSIKSARDDVRQR